ncbi:uncharacterized protein LOC119725385 [Patiria miniata]|uniref:Uncharacterized protein n=1 Tax=Patiria miniata TaxID=46514 RepID=A0A913ZMX8_PATMI|nr:uncharacterized protein LOC119725385 [Patiria miniata]
MKTFAVCLLLVGCIGSCVALDCYSCFGCGDPFDPAGVTRTTCPSGNVCQAQEISSGVTAGLFNRGCTEADFCTPGCINAPGQGNICSYCCDEDLCNSKSIADAVEDIIHCYLCAYSSDPSASNFSSPACNNPFDPNGAGVLQLPCADGECGVMTTNYLGVTTVTRLCISNSTSPGGCTPGCDALNITCKTCCSDNLCNGGLGDGEAPLTMKPSAAPSTSEPSAAPPTTGVGKASVAAILLTSLEDKWISVSFCR